MSGGSDGVVRVWNSALKVVAEATVEPAIAKSLGAGKVDDVDVAVRSVCWDGVTGAVTVGLRCGEIRHIAFGAAATAAAVSRSDGVGEGAASGEVGEALTATCSMDQCCGLAVNPTAVEVAVVGDDGQLRVWNGVEHALATSVRLPTMSRAVAYSPDGQLVAAGMGADVGRGRRQRESGAVVVYRRHEMVPGEEARARARACPSAPRCAHASAVRRSSARRTRAATCRT